MRGIFGLFVSLDVLVGSLGVALMASVSVVLELFGGVGKSVGFVLEREEEDTELVIESLESMGSDGDSGEERQGRGVLTELRGDASSSMQFSSSAVKVGFPKGPDFRRPFLSSRIDFVDVAFVDSRKNSNPGTRAPLEELGIKNECLVRGVLSLVDSVARCTSGEDPGVTDELCR
jgi:hypothetical protein